MKDMSKKIFEKENQAEVSNNPRHQNKSLTQLVSLTLINGNRKNEFKSIDLKNNYTSISSRPLVFCKPEPKLKTVTTSSPQKQSPIKPKQVDTQSNELCKLINNYSEPILDYYLELNNQTPKNFLSNHTVSSNLRAKMVDWMVEVLTSYKCKDQTFFLAVKLMDSYLQKTSQKHIPQDLHLIGVTTMFMACKFEEIYPVKLQIVHEKIAHKKLTKDEIKDKETNILTALDFNFIGITVLDVITIVLSILNMNQQLYQITLYLAKLALYDYEFVNNHTYVQIACSALIVSSKIVEQIDQSLSSEVVIPLIVSTLKMDNSDAMDSANKLLNLAKGFDKQYPNLENLKKFSKFQLSDMLTTQP
ncbi:unnamed protein product [Paramecium octaurelia]|uniref:Cyclin-like domain-containing protein n=1 Tax=Paramecium octaurelia TaxID=43137 RepID=A0A8S1YCT2_PAROT|nr:unnamed protein product [Paramecium octaurelia]